MSNFESSRLGGRLGERGGTLLVQPSKGTFPSGGEGVGNGRAWLKQGSDGLRKKGD